MYTFEAFDNEGTPMIGVERNGKDVASIYRSEVSGILKIHWHDVSFESVDLDAAELDRLNVPAELLATLDPVDGLDGLEAGTVIAYGYAVAQLDNHGRWWVPGDATPRSHEEMFDDLVNYDNEYKIIHVVK